MSCRQSKVRFIAATCLLAFLVPLAPGRALAELSREDWYKLGIGHGKTTAVCTLYSVKHLNRDLARLWLRVAVDDHRKFFGKETVQALKAFVLAEQPACRDIWPQG